MKIAIDCRMSGKSGIGTFLDGALPYIKDSGNELFLFGGNESEKCSIKNFSIRERFFFPKKILKKINECDIYWTPYCNIPNGIKIPIYSTIHDVVFLDIKGLSGKLGTFVRKYFYKRAIKKSKAIFTVSNFSKQRIQQTLNCKKEIYVVYNGLPKYLEDFSPSTSKTNSIIFIGNIKKHKGLGILLSAFEKLCETQDSALPKLLIVGSQENFRTKDDSVSHKIEQLNCKFPSSVEFTGFVENQKLKQLLASAKVLVQPSLYEGFGIPPLQALNCGTKAIISDIPVFKEIYKDFPVTFFESENSQDLYEKLKNCLSSNETVQNVPKIYSYQRTANLILAALKQ